MRIKNTALAGAAVTALALAAPAQADLSFQAGDWTVGFDGNVNAFYTVTDSESDPNDVDGGLASVDDRGSKTHNIRTGLLPSKLGFSASTRQNGFDVEAYVSYWPGVDGSPVTGADRSAALGFGGANFRQVYLAFGNETMGTIKMGRDLGVFGSDAILNDMTIMGVGTVGPTLNGGNTTLGRIGTGYVYADFKAQFQYQTPDYNGLQATVAISEPLAAGSLANVPGDPDRTYSFADGVNGNQNNDRPAFEGKITYDFALPDGLEGRFWVGGIQQRVRGELANENSASHNAYAGEVGISAGVGPISGVAYYYRGKGIGTTAQLLDGYSINSESARKSDGFYLQGMYEVPVIGSKLGVSYGESRLDDNSGDEGTLLDNNSSWIGGIYHPLTPNLTLVAEYTRTVAENHDSEKNREHNVAVGGILFF
ncbi:porin [Methylonatrum kenyense]|uniref:porin n=1 Tax=Methylonatrum kenyense TaxID=455253 RepID=UPI0020C15F91|nr:porin [Methylonatrum kenyense]MCK8516150.1 porin [Methylonatrum kenyense]